MSLKKIIADRRIVITSGILLLLSLLLPTRDASAAPCDPRSGAPAILRHDLATSYCELCGYGYVTVIISNPYESADLTAMTLVENLGTSGLTFASGAPNPVMFSVNGGPAQAGGNPSVSGSVLTWTSAQIPALGRLRYLPGPPYVGFATIAVTFAVTRTTNPEGLVGANRNIEAQLTYSAAYGTSGTCFTGTRTVSSGVNTLPLREPRPVITKRGRNTDAAQDAWEYTQTVYGNNNDDVIWRIRIDNTSGTAALQDLRFDDLMQPGNLQVNYACPTEASAEAIANNNGVLPPGSICVPASNTINDFDVDNPFGDPNNDSPDRIDVQRGGTTNIFLVGKILPNASCTPNRTNTVSDIQWGCESQPPAGGVTAPSSGPGPGSATATLSTLSVNSGNNLSVVTAFAGVDGRPGAGSKGRVIITITNNTGGTIKGTGSRPSNNGIKLRDILPPQYVVDSTFTPTVSASGAYGTYRGMIDRIQWTNPAPGTFPLTTTDPAVALSNTAPEFRLYSSTTHPIYGDQFDMLRHGDQLVVTFGIILVRPQSYDKVANLDVREESPTSAPPGTDPASTLSLTNRLFVDFEDFCQPGVVKNPPNNGAPTTHTSNPEDLDIDIAGSELIFILTNDPAQRLPLTINLSNRGSHNAEDYTAYISFGRTMNVVTVPAGCTLVTPPLLDVWRLPAQIPPGARIYRYTGTAVQPGENRSLTFEVIKSTVLADLAADDLTFRADVVGEITLSNGTRLWFPTPVNPRADGGIDRANNYSLDGIRARVIGFNLLKSHIGSSEPDSSGTMAQIGEENSFRIRSGGWFGFQTPGFSIIAVQDIRVTDQLPDGQGYISSTDPYAASTSAILGVNLNPAGLTPPNEVSAPDYMYWAFNRLIPAQRITQRDHWFQVEMTSRLLNDPLNSSAAPNRHAAASTNTLVSTFQAVFRNDTTGLEEVFNLGPSTVGYPRVEVRRISLTVTEPRITVVKEVCNESLYGTGTGCSRFIDLADNGDAYNSYIYRITLTNEARSGGIDRAPAYDLTVTDVLDASDLAYVIPFGSDGLDNDGDGTVDEPNEGTIFDNIVSNGAPAVLTFAYSHSDALLRMNPGQSVRLYYRVDFDNDAAPLQTFVNTAGAGYDSLEGPTGHQSMSPGANGTVGGARTYNASPDTAQVRIIPVVTDPKRIARLSNTPLASSGTQPVSIGEELEYRLRTLLPVALLRSFTVSDQLPVGMSCSEAPPVNLDAAPYSTAGFQPGGTITPTCSGNMVIWNFGNQRITNGTVGNRYPFEIGFIARVENSALTNDGGILTNGAPATQATARYINESGSLVSHDFGQVDVQIREPRIVLTKNFTVANADAGDVLTVTVTAANSGTANAYNLRILDDLTGRDMTYIGNVGGANPPTNVDTTTLGPNRPIFVWSAATAVAPGVTIVFTFQVRVDTIAQPQESLDNTLQAAWTSLPGQTTAINSRGIIGADGTVSGLRNGALPNAGDAINDYEARVTASITVPAVTLTKTDLNPSLTPTIGAHKEFQVEIRLPEGTAHGVTATDNLNAGGVSYVLANNVEYDIAYTFQGIATINGQPPSENAFSAFPADNTSGAALWNIGTVVTQTENDPSANAIAPLIRIHYYGRINNDLVTDAGDTLRNAMTASYTHGESGAPATLTAATAAVTALEPRLTVSKAATNATPGKLPGDPVVGGDLIRYIITVPNGGTSTAHDVNLVDTLTAGQELDATFTPTAVINGTPAAGFTATPAGAPNGPLVWGRANGDNSLDIPVGGTLVLAYRAVVTDAGAGTLGNSVWVDWTSLNGQSTYERTGAGCPAWTAPNDYCTGPATTTTSIQDDTAFAKQAIADSYDVPPLSTAVDIIARVGDTVTYRLAPDLRGGSTLNVRVTDVLPAGMAFVETVSINGDTAAPYAPPASGAGSNFAYAPIAAANVPTAGQTGTLTWVIGNVVNNPYGDPTTDILEIVYRARILRDSGIPHIGTTAMTNAAQLNYTGAPVLTGTAPATVRQPILAEITKTDRLGRTSPLAVNVATDVMQFRLTARNSGMAPAYSVTVRDQLATQLDETSIQNVVVAIDGTALAAGSDYVYTPPPARGGVMQWALSRPVNPGQTLTMDYDIGFHTDFGPNQVWNNSASIVEYWSLPLPQQTAYGQRYAAVGPALFIMNNVANTQPPAKSIASPLNGEATIGEEVVYRITVPSAPVNAAMHDVAIRDTLDANLEIVSVTEVSGNGYTLIDTSVPPHQVNLGIALIPAGRQAVIDLRARLRNIAGADAGVTFANSVLYTYADTPGGPTHGGGNAATSAIRIVEPLLAMTKTATNVTFPGNPPRAGHILRYTLTFTASGGSAGDNFSDAFDLRIDDSLSLGLAYAGNPTVNGAGNTIAAPVAAGDGVATAQTLRWSLVDGNADIDIVEGTTVTITYDVRVLNGVLANQILTNSATAQWTGIDGASLYERNGTRTPAWNDYFIGPAIISLTVPDVTAIAKTRLDDTYTPSDANVRIGDILTYELRLGPAEGTHADLTITDTLPQGLAFEGVVSINGDTTAPYTAPVPFSYPAIPATAIAVVGNPVTGPTTVTWNLGTVVNAADGNPTNDYFVLLYRARVVNEVLPQVNSLALVNTAVLNFTTATGPAPSRSDTETITVLQPNLAVNKSGVAAGGDTFLVASETVTYTVDIVNSGTAPAYDPLFQDILPLGMRTTPPTVVSMQILPAGTVLPNLAPVYTAATGAIVWDFDTGAADQYTIPAGGTLRIVYRAQTDVAIGAGLTLSNQAQVRLYYSFDDEAVPTQGGVHGVREIYGPTNTASVTFTTASPTALNKENPAVTTVAVGQPFTYTVTVPANPAATALYDVRILDDLSASAADMRFVSVAKVSGSRPWTPVNTGSATNLVIEDTAIGIDIPAGEQIVVAITVVLADTPTNVAGLRFRNTASYTFNQIDNTPATRTPGGADTTDEMTIVGPDNLTLDKTGPASMQLGTPGTFSLNIHNPATGAAWTPTIIDRMPNGPTGGMCAAPPTNIRAQIFEADGTTPASPLLTEGTHYTVSFTGNPGCEWRFELLSAAGGLGSTRRLIVRYDALLDPSSTNGASLTNVAGIIRWLSADPAAGGTPRVYTRTVTDGTPGTLDHEDNHTVSIQAPVLLFEKLVRNMTTGQNPGRNARPGDVLRYTLRVSNSGPVGLSGVSFADELDRLNAAPHFAAGTLATVTLPPGADTTGTNPSGGTNGTGILRVGNLTIGAQGSPTQTVTVEFDARLAPVITSGTVVLNQAELTSGSTHPILSDDPNVGGNADPTETLISSAPLFEVLKTSTILGPDPSVLMAGETLRYTITIKNIGTENAVNVALRDYTPANTVYVAGSTTLNGAAVPDAGPGVSRLMAGMPINAPENTTPGAMRADTSPGANNRATVTFDVVVDPGALDGLVICNQGFVSGSGVGSGAQPDQPSDNPNTPTPDDPTCNVVGNLPLLYARKTVQLYQDLGSPGVVDPGDVLRYTIAIDNNGTIPATGVRITDSVPANTTYVADSMRLNGLYLGSDGGVSPLIAGLLVQSSDNPGAGIVSPGRSATVTFEARVNAGTPTGTVIRNQGQLTADAVTPDLTDSDGVPGNGRQPTVIVVGDAQMLTITKEVAVVGGGAAQPGGLLEYILRVTNVSLLPATRVVLTDDLNPPLGDLITYEPGSGRLNGATAGVSFAGGLLTGDYATVHGDLSPGGSAVLRFLARINPTVADGTTITNIGTVRWNDPPQAASASVSIDVGGSPGSARLSGTVWHDTNLNRIIEDGERRLGRWAVELYRAGRLLTTVETGADGVYTFTGLLPNAGLGQPYEIRFRALGANPNTASMGQADSPFINGPQRISGINVAAGANLVNLNLPLWPNGTVFNSVVRVPITGARLRMVNAATRTHLPTQCFDDPSQQDQATAQDGFYKFDLNFSDPACPSGGDYIIEVTPPSTGYVTGPSRIIPPTSAAGTAAFSVPRCPGSAGDAVPATNEYCEATVFSTVPPPSVPPRTAGTIHYLHLGLDNGHLPGRSQIFNNPIAVDPVLDGTVAISKVASMVNVTRAALVPYTITVTNLLGAPLYDMAIVDRIPPGFKYVKGSARLDGVAREPRIDGRLLVWDRLNLQVNQRYTLKFLLVVGSGVAEGEYVNRAFVRNEATGGSVSGEATATVQVVPDPTFDCTDIIGKVFDDRNLNGRQDDGETGLAGVRVITARGLIATTDEHGRFHITCAAVPDEDRGSNFILKLDDRTLPTGYRMTTENPLVQRATRGKMMRFNFGATIHRVVRLDIADGVFEPDTTDLRLQWAPSVGKLVDELKKGPAILTLSYLADIEPKGLVNRRLDALKKEIAAQWQKAAGAYRLAIETEIYWRRGAPVADR